MSDLSRRAHPSLPIHRLDQPGRAILCAPGHVAALRHEQADELVRRWSAGQETSLAAEGDVGDLLLECARETVALWERMWQERFAPDCLLVYLTNRCNLRCSYCYSCPPEGRDGSGVVPEDAVRAAARLVARNCAVSGAPFTFVAHGGGEPTCAGEALRYSFDCCREAADEAGVQFHAHLATNGMLGRSDVQWVARRFTSVCVSCDGPPDIHDAQRAGPNGAPTAATVEETIREFMRVGAHIEVRATVTPASCARQVEVVEHIAGALSVPRIRLEPQYRVGGGPGAFTPDDAECFVESFLAAQARGAQLGCEVMYAGVRLDELHGPHCSVGNQALHLMPDGAATGCFFCVDADTCTARGCLVGQPGADGEYHVDAQAAERHRRKLGAIPAGCRDCIAAYHCNRGCPEACVLDAATRGPGGFRCRVNKALTERWIVDAAARLDESRRVRVRAAARAAAQDEARLRDYLSSMPAWLDREAVIEEWRRVTRHRRLEPRPLPLPYWARRGLADEPQSAWATLRDAVMLRENAGPLSAYLHVPFCERRCPFCDCLAVPLGRDSEARQGRFTEALCREIEAWASLPGMSGRRVTTVHFGGGTPNCLAPVHMSRIVAALRSGFGVDDSTEFALESTSSLLSGEHVAQLLDWGFIRLHVGVQSLDDEVRRIIGRREAADTVLRRVRCAIDAGMVVSVDLIYGLPAQTAAGFCRTLEELIRVGVHGVSVYRLQTTGRNERFLRETGAAFREPLHDYALLQAAAGALRGNGYEMTHFTHFARPEDANLYYGHAIRGEDLLALGPTADGLFGDYLYRHGELNAYLEGASARGAPGLEGGVREPPEVARLRPVRNGLMACRLDARELAAPGISALADRFLEQGLMEATGDAGRLRLTTSGCWFISDMLQELEEAAVSGAG